MLKSTIANQDEVLYLLGERPWKLCRVRWVEKKNIFSIGLIFEKIELFYNFEIPTQRLLLAVYYPINGFETEMIDGEHMVSYDNPILLGE